jgi:hypothetical protein
MRRIWLYGHYSSRQKWAFAPTAALHKYTAEPPVCLAAAEVADGARRS